MIGKTISHYKIIKKLAESDKDVVYKADDKKLKRHVVVKFISPDLTRDSEAKKRFIFEAQAASSLDHPNICTVYEITETECPATSGKQLFVVLAFHEGEFLKNKIEQGSLKIDEAVNLSIQIAEGLRCAPDAGISHQLINPLNITVTKRGEIKIMDFGLANLIKRNNLLKSDAAAGAVSYLSPGQVRGETVDYRTDIWSLGIILYEMLCGKLPFRGEYGPAMLYSILKLNPEPVTQVRSEVPADLEKIVNKALAKSQDSSYQTVGMMLDDLQKLTIHWGISARFMTGTGKQQNVN